MVLYGFLYLFLGVFLSAGFREAIKIFPQPILGVILMFEGLALMRLARDMMDSKADFTIVLMVGLMAIGLPYGYVVGLLTGTIVAYLVNRKLVGLAE